MKTVFICIAFLCGLSAQASPITADEIHAEKNGLTVYSGRATIAFPKGDLNESLLTQSSPVAAQLKAVYDVPALGGSTDTDYTLPITLPKGAILTRAWIDVITQPVANAGDSPTLSISAAADQDILADSAPGALTTGQKLGVEDGTTGKAIKMSAAKSVKVNIKSGGLSAGRLVLFLDYLPSY